MKKIPLICVSLIGMFHLGRCWASVLLLWLMMTCLLSVSLDHGRGRRQRPRPHPGRSPSILWSHHVRCTGVHLAVCQNIPEQNLPRVPGQEKAHEKQQGFVRGQRNTLVMAETAVSVWRKGIRLRFCDLCCAAASFGPAYYLWTPSSEVCEPGRAGGCVVSVNRVLRL